MIKQALNNDFTLYGKQGLYQQQYHKLKRKIMCMPQIRNRAGKQEATEQWKHVGGDTWFGRWSG